MTIPELLARAAELAPEWCRRTTNGWQYDNGLYILRDGTIYDFDRALILVAVLKECERRGMHIGIERERYGYQGDMHYFIRLTNQRNQRSIAHDMDVTTAALGAFAQLLEAEHEVST